MSNPILSVKNLTKSFGKHIVINNVSFDVRQGEVFGLLGPTDSGKSAILRAISGALIPNNGEIMVNDYTFSKDYEKAVADINGYIKLPKLYRYMTGIQNMRLITQLRGKYSDEILRNCANITNIGHLLDDKVAKYTLAEKHLLCIASAIATNPKLVILDDPFVGLNAKELKQLQDLIKLLSDKYKIAFVLSSQMLGQMEKVCDTIAIVNHGSILEIRNMQSLLLDAQKDQKLAITVDYPNFAGKIVINEFNLKVQLCGNKILVYTPEVNKDKILQRLANYRISVFGVKVISKSLEQLLEEVLQQKAMNKSWVEEYS